MAENVSWNSDWNTDLWKSQSEFNEKLNSNLNQIQEMMNSMMDMIQGLNKSTSSQNFQSSSSSPVASECSVFPPLEAGIRVTDGAGQTSTLKMETPGVEESIISLEELTRQIIEGKVFEEMSHQISIDTAETQGTEDDYFRLQLKSNGLRLNTINRWSESEIKNAYVEGSLTEEAKKDEQSKEGKLESMEIIYPSVDQVELKLNAQLQASGNGDFGSTIAAKKLSDECLQLLHSPHKVAETLPIPCWELKLLLFISRPVILL